MLSLIDHDTKFTGSDSDILTTASAQGHYHACSFGSAESEASSRLVYLKCKQHEQYMSNKKNLKCGPHIYQYRFLIDRRTSSIS